MMLQIIKDPSATSVKRSLHLMIMPRNQETLSVLELERRVVLHRRICLVDPCEDVTGAKKKK